MDVGLPLTLSHLGAKEGVTGSCHLLHVKGLNILVDCGSFQGNDRPVPIESWPVKPADIHFLFVTHAHIDHIGRIPELIQRGFQGEILTTHPTKALLIPMLEDAMGFSGIQEVQATRICKTIEKLSWRFDYGEVFDLKKGLRFKLGRAGHILGSCFVRLEDRETGRSVIFSGDLGAFDTPLLPDPEPPDPCDVLVLESTYGDTLHRSRHDRVRRLGSILSKALSDGGKVFIPAFALGRSQELIYEMDRLYSDAMLQREFPRLGGSKVPVLLDSPLGIRLTKIYSSSSLAPYWDREAKDLLARGDNPIDFNGLYTVTRHQDHNRLLEMKGPAVIIAGSGMCTGGRIVDHLRAGLEDPRNDVLFVGYQAEGTLGRRVIESVESIGSLGRRGVGTIESEGAVESGEVLGRGRKADGYVELDGERVRIRAGVHVLPGYSAHADQKGLMDWVATMPEKPGSIRLVHGEARARKALGERLRAGGYRVVEF